MKIELYLTPVRSNKVDLKDKTVAVIDVLRCTTTVCAALMAGAKGVIPVAGPGEAGDLWAKLGSELSVLAGERHGVKIENFNLGNSPAEFTPESVGNKIVIMTTTNGTLAFTEVHGAAEVLSCSLVNVSSVARRVAEAGRDLMIVCAGREGHFSIEDTVCGGMLIHLLSTEYKLQPELNDAGSLSLLLYRTNSRAILRAIAQGEHGRFLSSIGFASDIETAADVDSMPVLPIMRDGRLVQF
ncbi:MAG TPA: 2-phosphosulfolactate phosphatase [candidate division Zixibacteria bacterium]|nr:2-phosphosulfolactate phosphatase [candidate division Zixibacteria bacterium]